MKEIVKMSRLTGSLEKLFNKINADWFNGELETPVITVQSTPRAYGHYSVAPIWSVKGETLKHEINIGAGTLDRPIEETVSTLIHEMVHMYTSTVLKVPDTSNRGIYHNKTFKAVAEAHGLIVTRSDKYGWSHTEPSDALIDWILVNDIQEIKLNRDEPSSYRVGGPKTANGGAEPNKPKVDRSGTRRWTCPKCGTIIRSTREVRVICADCMEMFVQS